jgi:polyhydroxyalkanoate synthesis regulator phasin
MVEIHKKVVLDENQKPFAVQIPIEEFERLEEILENYGLAKLMDEVVNDEKLSIEDAKTYYQALKTNVES